MQTLRRNQDTAGGGDKDSVMDFEEILPFDPSCDGGEGVPLPAKALGMFAKVPGRERRGGRELPVLVLSQVARSNASLSGARQQQSGGEE